MTSASRLRVPVVFERATTAADGAGGFTESFSTFTRYAQIFVEKSDEKIEDGARAATGQKTLIVRRDRQTAQIAVTDAVFIAGARHAITGTEDRTMRGAFIWISAALGSN